MCGPNYRLITKINLTFIRVEKIMVLKTGPDWVVRPSAGHGFGPIWSIGLEIG